MRKLIIGLAAMGVVLVGFWAYIQIMDPPKIETQDTSNVVDMDIPENLPKPQQIGEIVPSRSEDAEYRELDPVTKEVKRILGFEELLNPGESLWHVKKPYMVFVEKKYQCRIESESGVFQADSLQNAAPKDAKLDGKVVIHIEPEAGSKMSETFIYMDDLTFSSERSEFATDGPVKIVSDQVLMDGYGLTMIFNTQDGRIDYMHIRDLDSLILKNFATEDSPLKGSSGETDTAEDTSTQKAMEQNAVAQGGSNQAQQSDTPAQKEAKRSDYYQCLIEDNVLIKYGDELIVSGADQVSIQNILFKQSQDALFGGDSEEQGTDSSAAQSEKQVAANTSRSSGQQSAEQQTVSAPSSGKDIVVTCDGGIILKPVDGVINARVQETKPELAMKMSGAPLRIERCMPEKNNQFETLARCGLLTYTPTEDILRLFRDSQREIVLNAQDSRSRIETRGSILWNRRTQQANIAGPGTVYLQNSSDPDTEPSEVEFAGMMDLLFAPIPDDTSSATIQTINLTGGMNAILKQNGWYKTTAETAKLDFGPKNSLAQARLLGGVEFSSLEADKPQRAVSDSALFEFGPENSLNTAHMEGGVLFESRDNDKQSRAEADQAVFHFNDNKISVADLNGAVSFASDTGQLTASNAQIEFKPDAAGSMQPGVVHTTGESVLQTVTNSPDKPPAKFEAQKIDYDLQTGSGLAHGPIRFTFYPPADEDSTTVDAYVPVTITADENADFLADGEGNINQVIFNGNVVAFRTFKTLKYEQRDNFHGEKLVVNIADNAQGKPDVSSIVMKDGDVFAESVRMDGEKLLSNIKLNCKEIHYGQLENMMLAQGPGKIELVNNQERPEGVDVETSKTGFDFNRPCVALVDNFQAIHWDLNAQKILADGDQKTMKMGYYPLIGRMVEKQMEVYSMQLELSFKDDVNGKPMLDRIFTDKGIIYEEWNGTRSKRINQIVGQTLDYDASGNDWLKIMGSESNPCYVNGSRQPSVFYNVTTGKLKTSLSTRPGFFSR